MKISEETKSHIKRYIKSFTVSFLAGFCIAVVPMLDSLSFEDFATTTLVGIIFAGFRTGIKFMMESFLRDFRNFEFKK